MFIANIATSGGLITLSLLYLFFTGSIHNPKEALLGPRYFPYVVLFAIIFLNIINIIRAFLEKREHSPLSLKKNSIIRFFITLAMFYLYISVIEVAGFIIATIVFLFGLGILFSPDKKLKTVIVTGVLSIILPILFYLLFHKVFHVLLP